MADPRLWLRLTLVVLSAAVLQRGVFSRFQAWSVIADLLLLVAIASAMVVGPERGAITGFTCGLLVDLQVHTPFGLTALTFSLVAYFIGRFESTVVRSSRPILMLTGFAGTLLGQVTYVVLGTLVGVSAPQPARVAVIGAVAGLWSAALTPVALRAMRWAWREPAGPRLAFSPSRARR